jgi:hypothetical protein
MKKQAGKGDKPRNCFSKRFKENYDHINWNNKDKYKLKQKERK